MTFHLKFISILVASVLTSLLVFFTSGMKGLPNWGHLWWKNFKSSKSISLPTPKKTVSKDLFREEPEKSENSQNFTFFDTLMDTQLSKQIGLDGKLSENPPSASISLIPTDSRKPSPVSKTPDPPISGSLAGKGDHAYFQASVEFSGDFDHSEKPFENKQDFFLVQAGSFKSWDRAQTMVRKMKQKGFDSFLKKTPSPSSNSFWYRVYLGRFKEKEKALKMVFRARSQENLRPILVLRRE